MKPVTIEGCACIVGRMYGKRSAWIVREPITGLTISNPAHTRKGAVEDAARKIQSEGGEEAFLAAIQTNFP